MAERPITEKQYRLLLVLGSGAMALAPGRGDWGPLVRRGLVEMQKDDEDKRYYPPLRISPAGFRALADGLERFGHQSMKPSHEVRQLDEHPRITQIKADLDESRQKLRDSQIKRQRLEAILARTRRVLEEIAA